MLSSTFSAGLCGIDGFPVTVECNQKNNLEGFDLVGLPDMAVREAKERVRTACYNSGYSFPYARITVNLAPAHRRGAANATFYLAFDAAISIAATVWGVCIDAVGYTGTYRLAACGYAVMLLISLFVYRRWKPACE